MINTQKLIDLSQIIFVPITDETQGNKYVREESMTVGEFFNGILDEFKPELVDAIPVTWLEDVMKKLEGMGCKGSEEVITALIDLWHADRRANQDDVQR